MRPLRTSMMLTCSWAMRRNLSLVMKLPLHPVAFSRNSAHSWLPVSLIHEYHWAPYGERRMRIGECPILLDRMA